MKINPLPPIALLLMLSSFCSKAQTGLYIDGGLLYVKSSSILHIEGELKNKLGSTLKNDGVIELVGNLSNDSAAIFMTGTDNTSTERTFKFIGSSRQTIQGNFSDTASSYIYNLIIDKASSGAVVELNTNTKVKGSLVFGSGTNGADTYTPTSTSTLTNNSGNGIIKTYDTLNNDYELYIINPAPAAIRGYAPLIINAAPTNAFIMNRGAQGVGIGGLARNVSQTNVAYIFPIGTSLNGYNATSMKFDALASNPDKVRGMFVDATGGVGFLSRYCYGCGSSPYGAGFNYYFHNNPCNSNHAQWVILNSLPHDHGYWSYSGNASDIYTVEMFPNSFPAFGGTSGATWRIIKKDVSITAVPSGDWTGDITSNILSINDLLTYTTTTGCYAGSGVPGGDFIGFSSFQMIRSSTNVGLPIKLIYLTAEAIENKFIRLNWATAEEVDNKGFEVERSENGTDFASIGWVEAQGNGNTVSGAQYKFNDNTAIPNLQYYYRLKQVDYDGKSDETYIVQANLSGVDAMSVSSFFPNPSNTNTHMMIHAPNDTRLTLEVYDILGQLIERTQTNVLEGDSQFEFNTGKLPAGNYKALIKTTNNVFINSLNIIR